MENFQNNSAPPNVKYNCVVLFLCQLYLLIIYVVKYFLIDHHYKKGMSVFTDLLEKAKFFDVPAACFEHGFYNRKFAFALARCEPILTKSQKAW